MVGSADKIITICLREKMKNISSRLNLYTKAKI